MNINGKKYNKFRLTDGNALHKLIVRNVANFIMDKGGDCEPFVAPVDVQLDCNYTKKLAKYMEAGVREYWILDSDQQKLLVYFFESDSYPVIYGLDTPVPIGIYHGELVIEFEHIKKWIDADVQDDD